MELSAAEGDSLGNADWEAPGLSEGEVLGTEEGVELGVAKGEALGDADGESLGLADICRDGDVGGLSNTYPSRRQASPSKFARVSGTPFKNE